MPRLLSEHSCALALLIALATAHAPLEAQEERRALVGVQGQAERARSEGDAEKRLELLAGAARGYRDFLDRHGDSALAGEAQRSYLGLLTHYGRALELALEDAQGPEASALRATIERELADGLARTRHLAEAYERPALGPAEKLEKWRVLLERAELRITRGRAADDPQAELGPAALELESVVREAGATSGPGLNACLQLARLNRVRASFDHAAELAEFVLSTAIPEDPSLWRGLEPEERSRRLRLAELAVPDLLASHAARGDVAAACKGALRYHMAWKQEGLPLSTFGHLALLAVARTLADAGGFVGGSVARGTLRWAASEAELASAGGAEPEVRPALDLALEAALEVSRANEGNTLQVRARALLAAALRRPGATVAPAAHLEVALGELHAGQVAAAIEDLEDLARALEARDEALRREFLPRVLFTLGQCHTELARPLEAALAFRAAATTSGDAELQGRAARGFHARADELRRANPGDARSEELWLQAEELLARSGGDDDVVFRQAERRYAAGDFDAARQGYRSVGAGADVHEKAEVKAALCLLELGDAEGARRELEEVLRIVKLRIGLEGFAGRRLAASQEAAAQATFSLGRLAHEAGDHARVLELLAGYERDFPSQLDYAVSALGLVLQAHLARQDTGAARATLATMQASFPTSPHTGKAALELYRALSVQQESASEAGAAARSRALERERAACLRLANRIDPEPAFGNLRAESALWLALEDWVAAEEVLRSILAAFADAPERAEAIETLVLPDLGRALLGERRVSEAFAILDPLIPKNAADTRRPAAALVRDWCRSVSGWPEGSPGAPSEVQGAGTAQELPRALELLGKLIELETASEAPGHGAWTCPWYELEFERLYTLLRWSREDPSRKTTARRLLEDIASQLGPDLGEIGASCGDDLLRQRYLWIRERLR